MFKHENIIMLPLSIQMTVFFINSIKTKEIADYTTTMNTILNFAIYLFINLFDLSIFIFIYIIILSDLIYLFF
jgi:hypothetical protein